MNFRTIEDGITYCIETANEYKYKASLYDLTEEFEFANAHLCEERAEDYQQLAKWLTELKNIRG